MVEQNQEPELEITKSNSNVMLSKALTEEVSEEIQSPNDAAKFGQVTPKADNEPGKPTTDDTKPETDGAEVVDTTELAAREVEPLRQDADKDGEEAEGEKEADIEESKGEATGDATGEVKEEGKEDVEKH